MNAERTWDTMIEHTFQAVPDPKKIDVLDHGSVELIDFMGSDLSVVNAARVSFSKESTALEVGDGFGIQSCLRAEDMKLIKYLATHKHWTPFAHPQVSMRFKTPIPIRTQLDKSRQGLVINESSRRYVITIPEAYKPVWRSKPEGSIKQGSGVVITDPNILQESDAEYTALATQSISCYERQIARGIAPEQARFSLIQGVYTEFIWTGSLAAWARVYNLRKDPDAQWEAREYAEAIKNIVAPLFPISWQWLTQQA